MLLQANVPQQWSVSGTQTTWPGLPDDLLHDIHWWNGAGLRADAMHQGAVTAPHGHETSASIQGVSARPVQVTDRKRQRKEPECASDEDLGQQDHGEQLRD